MKRAFPLFAIFLLIGCSHNTMIVRLSDAANKPISGFPIHFQLDEGIYQANAFGFDQSDSTSVNRHGLLLEGELTRLDQRIYGTRTNSMGIARISFGFEERQRSFWSFWLLKAEALPDADIHVIPQENLPKGTRISISLPNP